MRKSNLVHCLLSIFIVLSLLLCPVVYAEENGAKNYDEIKKFIMDNYRFDISSSELDRVALMEILKNHPELWEEAMSGMLDALDPYSTYLDKDEYKAWMDNVGGTFAGIGVSIEKSGEYIVIIGLMENSPAQKAGIKVGDRILAVDGTDVRGYEMDQIKKVVMGEAGTKVTLKMQRDNVDILEFEVVRESIALSTVFAETKENGTVGYLRITQFATNTPEQVKKALEDFKGAGISKLILDLRNNPGGERDAVMQIAEMFMPEGPIAHLEFKKTEFKKTYSSKNTAPYDFNMVVLINQFSASASELLAGALKDSKEGVLVGRTTFGKGTVQTIVPLKTGGGIKMTIATYTTAGGHEVNGVGVSADYTIVNTIYPAGEYPYFNVFQYETEIGDGSNRETVLALQQRLMLLGLLSEKALSGVYDEATRNAVLTFQKKQEFEQNGRADIYVQMAIDNATYDMKVEDDLQYKKAIALLAG